MPSQSSKLGPFTIFYQNQSEFHHLKQEVFTKDAYYFESSTATPRIIDAGAHIGLATLYFKKIFPGAKITAIEPNPNVLPLLEQNVFENQLDNVDVMPVALAESAGTRQFYLDETELEWWSTAGFTTGAWNGQQRSRMIEVPTRPLADFLTEPIDFLKMDIEGAEQAVLTAAAEKLYLIRQMLVEFHHTGHQSLPDLTRFLTDHHFEVKLYQQGKELQPAQLKKLRGLVYIEAKKPRRPA